MSVSIVKPKISIIFWYVLIGIPVGVVTFGVIMLASVKGMKNPGGFIQFLLTTGMLYGLILGIFPALLTGVAMSVLRANFVSKLTCLMAGVVGVMVTVLYLLVISAISSGQIFDSAFIVMFLIPAFVASSACCYFFVLEKPAKKPD